MPPRSRLGPSDAAGGGGGNPRTVTVPRQGSGRTRGRGDVGERLYEVAQLVARALALADRDPETADRLARQVLRRRSLPAELRLDARLALGRAAWVRRDTTSAISALRAAARLADAAGSAQRGAQARLTLAAALAERGHTRAALAALSAAEPYVDGIDAARLAGQRAYVHHLEGRLGEALDGHRAAYDAFRRLGDELRQAVALHNMALLHTHAGALGQAAAELGRARELFDRAGERRNAADAAANLGWVLARQGLVPQALRWFDVADAALGPHAGGDPEAAWHRAEAFLDARMLGEALDAARVAASGAAARGTPGPAVECRLLAARVALLQGDLDAAREQASAAQHTAGTRFPALRALARQVALVADLNSGVSGAAAAGRRRSALRVADLLTQEGWQLQAVGARVVAARLALAAGRADAARSDLAGAIVVRARGPLQLRIAATHARALLHVVEGDRAAARAALRAGVRDLDRHRLSLGATELQTLATGHALEVLGLGLDLALEAGDAWEALTWSERGRAASLRSRPPGDQALTESLDALRQSAAATERALLDGSDPRRA